MKEEISLDILEKEFEETLGRLVGDEEQIEALSEEVVDEMMQNIVRECSDETVKSYRKLAKKNLRNERKFAIGFERRLLKRWKPAFDHLEIMWFVANELGQLHSQALKSSDENLVNAALSQIFPRGLLVTQEIICLLKGGFPDGALARWRTLHELSVTMMYIRKRGEEAAREYLLSFPFAARRAAHQMNLHSERAGLDAFGAEQLAALDERCRYAEGQLGRVVEKDADGEWPKITLKHPNFARVEEFVEMDHWRPRFKWASVHTHASHRLADRLLGMSEAKEPVQLVGASNSGFVDPFQMAAISLNQMIVTYLMLTPNLDRIVHCRVMTQFAEEMASIAIEAERTSLEKFRSA